jgi:hypothetical protein
MMSLAALAGRSARGAAIAACALALAASALSWQTPVARASCQLNRCYTLNVTMHGTGSGTVTASSSSIDCRYAHGVASGTCTANYVIPLGQQAVSILLTSTPGIGDYACSVAGCGATNKTISLTFDFAEDYTLSFGFVATKVTLAVGSSGSGSGFVESSDGVINCPGTCSAPYDYGSVVTLSTLVGTGHFGGWTGGCSGAGATCQVTMNGPQSVTALFTLQSPAPSPSRRSGATPKPGSGGTPAAGATGSPSAGTPEPSPTPSPAGGASGTATPASSGIVLAETSEPSAAPSAASQPASPDAGGSGDVPWLPIIVILLILVGGVNLLAFQLVRTRRS